MSLTELSEEFGSLGLPGFRAKQVYAWLHRKWAREFSEMTDLSKPLRESLANEFQIRGCSVEHKSVSKRDGTVKYLFSLHDGELIEAVLMKYKYGYTLCVSTQAGCKMNCAFCATGSGGFARNLTPGEMLSELYTAQRDSGVVLSHIVLMGMGEPLDNFENVMRFLKLVNNPDGMNLGMRNISLSTCGLVPKINDLMSLKPQFTLSVSLHAPNDSLRNKLMPVNKSRGIDSLLTACRRYAETTSRRISFEYAMFAGFNDSDECALELASKLKGILCHINLIPANDVETSPFKASSPQRIAAFSDILTKKGFTVTVRRSLGGDIDASCGQLKQKFK